MEEADKTTYNIYNLLTFTCMTGLLTIMMMQKYNQLFQLKSIHPYVRHYLNDYIGNTDFEQSQLCSLV